MVRFVRMFGLVSNEFKLESNSKCELELVLNWNCIWYKIKIYILNHVYYIKVVVQLRILNYILIVFYFFITRPFKYTRT